MKCYNLIFNTKILLSNIGFYSLFSMFVSQIIFVFVYLVKGLNSLKSFMIKFENLDSNENKGKRKRKRKRNIHIIKNRNPKNIQNKMSADIKLISVPSKKRKNKKKIYNKLNKDIKNGLFIEQECEKKNNGYILKSNKKSDSEKKIINEDLSKNEQPLNKLNSNISKSSLVSNHLENNIHIHNIYKLFQTIYDFLDMDYEEAILYDKKGYLKIFWGFLLIHKLF